MNTQDAIGQPVNVDLKTGEYFPAIVLDVAFQTPNGTVFYTVMNEDNWKRCVVKEDYLTFVNWGRKQEAARWDAAK